MYYSVANRTVLFLFHFGYLVISDNGHQWTYCSSSALTTFAPYWSKKIKLKHIHINSDIQMDNRISNRTFGQPCTNTRRS